jgi:LysM repeat protein
MTRDTKIGLLVGLAFIIVIGILLSDHLTTATDPPSAPLDKSAFSVRQALGTPGAGAAQAPITVVTPAVTPQQPVATSSELAPPAQAVQIVKIGGPALPQQNNAQQSPSAASQPQRAGGDNNADVAKSDQTPPGQDPAATDSPVVTRIPSATTPSDSDLSRIAQAGGEPIVAADNTRPAPAKTYVAQPGDSLSKIAARFYGSGGKANRLLIIKANPSLAANENMIIAGKTYKIPALPTPAAAVSSAASVAPEKAAASDSASANPTTPPSVDDTAAKTAADTQEKSAPDKLAPADANGYLYTVQPGDNLTRIARDELGDIHAIAAIKELNRDRLKGPNHDILIAGSELRLPSKPLAKAD